MAEPETQVLGGGKKVVHGDLGFSAEAGVAGGQGRKFGAPLGANGAGSMEAAGVEVEDADREEVVDREEDTNGWDQFGPDPELEDVFEGGGPRSFRRGR